MWGGERAGRREAPAFAAALLLAAGILSSDLVPPAVPLHLIALPFILIPGIVAALLRSGFQSAASAATAAALVLLGCLSGFHSRLASPELPERLSGALVVAEGRVADDPQLSGRSLRVLVDITRIGSENEVVAFQGRAIMRWAPARGDTLPPMLREGSLIAAVGTIYRPGGPRNPGEFDVGRWMRANGIDAELAVRGRARVICRGEDGPGLIRRFIVRPLRHGILGAINRHVGGEEGAFLKGLVIGERSEIDPAMNEAFTRAGVSHVLAVSGSNVALVLLFIGALLRPLRRAPLLRSALLCAGALVYLSVSGAQPPVARATVMACTAVGAIHVQERVNALNLLGVAALFLLAADPASLFDIGFQLSFCAVLSLVLLSPRSERLIRRIPVRSRGAALLVGTLRLMAVSGIATLGTLPLTAEAFGRVSVVGIVANIVVVPATGIALLLGGVIALCDPLSGWLASLYGEANRGLLWFTIWFTKWIASPSWASLSTHWFTPIHGAIGWGALWAFVSFGSARFRVALLGSLALLALSAWLPPDPLFVPDPGTMRVTVMDVGQGDAILVQTPGGARVLIDAGPASPFSDAGRKTIIPFLDRTGSRRIDALIITHDHLDHTGGLRSLLRWAEVCSLFASPAVARRLTEETGRFFAPVSAGSRIDIGPGGRCYVVAPAAAEPDSTGNGASVVVKLVSRRSSWLLTGDAPIASEGEMVRRYGGFLAADVLKGGHHGSLTSSGSEFLQAVRPSVAVMSVGKNNRFGHPASGTLERFAARRIPVLRTDIGGGIITADSVRLASPDACRYVLTWR